MHVSVFAIGRMKKGAETELVQFYADRFTKSAPTIGLKFDGIRDATESRAATSEQRKKEEAKIIATALKTGSLLVLLDEHGQNLSSRKLAQKIGKWRDEGNQNIVFVIGGPDGFSHELLSKSDMLLSFGAQTWPHRLARIMLTEQLYRSALILANHPYHRD